MDIMKSLKNVTNLNEYISVTQEVNSNSKNVKVQINITTVLTLKKIRSLEIEYINKCEENGVACVILERLLALPPSKTWGVLGKELICLIQYWLEAIRKHLMNHSHNWWTFLKQLLIFIKDIRLKAPCIPNLLVEFTAECLLDLATAEQPDASQRHEILHTFNMYCAESGREIRFAMRNKFSDYFVKLSTLMATSGYLPYQYSTLECLVRWLVPRQERSLRTAAANKWFPSHLYPTDAVQIFLHTTWMNFFQDARSFLNALNYANGLVTSVVCRRLSIGNINVISGSEKQQSWLDINSNEKSLSVLLDPRVLDRFESVEHRACETLLIHNDIMSNAQLHGDSGITLSINTTKSPCVRPSDISLGDEKNVTITVSSRTDLHKMDAAMRQVFGDKYQVLLDLDSQISLSPPRSLCKGRHDSYSEEDTRFSHPVEVKRKRHCGYLVRSKNTGGINTPSTASTSSLAQLHEKLAALPRLQYDREPVSICAQPQLSSVTEHTERDDRSFNTTSTLKFRPYGVCHKNLKPYTEKKAQSDSETIKTKSKLGRTLSPIASDDNTSLLAVTVNSDDNLILTTAERPGRNIVDLLAQEALQTKASEKINDSGINTDENKKSQETENSEAIEGTPVIEKPKKKKVKKACTVVSKSTTDDESNTEANNDTIFVSLRNRRNQKVTEENVAKTFDVSTVENFFSQHFTENKRGEIDISPTLAKKINETSSETSEQFDDQYLIMNENFNADEELFQFNDIEIIECLNDIVDKVCNEFNKCTEYLLKETNVDNSEIQVEKEKVTSTPKKQVIQNEDKPAKGKKTQSNIKIKLKTPRKKKTKRVVSKKIKNTEPTLKKMSTIVEQKEEEEVLGGNGSIEINTNIVQSKIEEETPLNRRKRKLYSPKYDNIEIESAAKIYNTDDDDEVIANFKTKPKTQTSTTSCYKEIEKERKRYTRSRPRRSSKNVAEPPSPRTIKNNTVFDHLKDTVENTEKITLADKSKIGVYNFTSESEDEDFKKKKIDVKNRISSNTLTSVNSVAFTRRGRRKTRVNYSESKSSADESKKPVTKRKQTKRTSKRKVNIEAVNELVDERMRDTTDVLNTSIVNTPQHQEIKDTEPLIENPPEMEPDKIEPAKSAKKPKKPEIIKVKKEKARKTELAIISNRDEDASISPLPGLVVEFAPDPKEDVNNTLTTNLLQKFKKIYQEGPENVTNTTQNMLLEDERVNNNSQQNISLSVTEQIFFATSDKDPILIEEDKRTSRQSKLKSSQNVTERDDVMDICSIPERNYDVSIPSDGITAHGDIEEEPPSPKTIKQTVQNREVVDLNQSIKDYFEKLTKEMIKSDSDSKECRHTKSIEEKKRNISSSSDKSPVVSLKRLSIEDISRFLPSRRSTETESSKSSKKSQIISNKNMRKVSKSPPASVARISLEEFNKWLPPMPNNRCSDNEPNTSQNSRSKLTFNERNKENLTPKTKKGPKFQALEEIIKKPICTRSFTKKLATKSESKSQSINKLPESSSNVTSIRKSNIISPVKSFEDFARNSQTDPESDGEYSKTIKTLSRQKSSLRKESRILDLSKEFRSPLKRTSSPIQRGGKRPKYEDTVTIDSGPSASSIHEWFKRSEPKNSDPSNSFHDTIQNIIEKLDTTLVEVNQNTSRKFVKLFVEAQSYLTNQKVERLKLYKSVTNEIMSKMMEVMQQKFNELDENLQTKDDEFMDSLKKQAFELVKEDCKQKRAMVILLKEDVQAVKDHINSTTRTTE